MVERERKGLEVEKYESNMVGGKSEKKKKIVHGKGEGKSRRWVQYDDRKGMGREQNGRRKLRVKRKIME